MAVVVLLIVSLVSSLYSGTQAAPSQLGAFTKLVYRATSDGGLGGADLDVAQCSCPNTRSLVGIVWSCLTTVTICTWVAVHPNLPPPGEPRWRTILRRMKLMFWGLIGPELILGWSIRQWIMARKISKEYANRGWSEIHGFLFVMGGFSLVKADEDLGTLSYSSFTDLVRAGDIDFPVVMREDIEDKSKGDPLSKAFVILQTSWFIVQCIGRAVLGLALTELEIVTLAFCSVNAVVYFFWWHKPLDIERRVPIYLRPDSSYCPESKSKDVDEIQEADRTSKEIPVPVEDSSSREKESNIKHTTLSPIPGCARFSVQNGIISVRRVFGWWFSRLRDTIRKDLEAHNIVLLVLFIWPFGRPLAAILYLLGYFIEVFIVDNMTAIMGDEDSENILSGIKRVNTFYSPKLRKSDDLTTTTLYSLIGCAFGALHCIAWNFHFPTYAEHSLWRSLSLIITFSPLALFYPFLSSFTEDEDGEFRQHIENRFLRALEFVAMLTTLILIICYIPFRLILLIESFITLRSVQPSVLLDINWEDFIPHL